MTQGPAREDPLISRLQHNTELAQQRASRPDESAWVSANAGAGKTHVLKMRVLRLLLNGVDPTRLLCLTYTKAAAAEMAERVFADLAKWTVMSDDGLANELTAMTGRTPNDADLTFARQLFARAIETPGGLKVQTIHAFAERLLHRFPIEAGLPPGFQIIDDDMSARLRSAALDETLNQALNADETPLGRALQTVIAYATEDQFDQVLRETLRQRGWLDAIDGLLDQAPTAAGQPELLYLFLANLLDLEKGLSEADIDARIATVASDADIAALTGPLSDSKGTSDTKLADQVRAAVRCPDDAARAQAFVDAFLTADFQPRKGGNEKGRFISKGVRLAHPGLAERFDTARDTTAHLMAERHKLQLVEATHALVLLTRDIHNRFKRGKLASGAMDFDDLIKHTVKLLETTDSAQWVLYKLDGGIDHVLVDEAQDTSPDQWTIIKALAGEFFSQQGPDDRGPRSVFAVGDEKQSIYSFQGAAPRMFANAGDHFATCAAQISQTLHRIPLTLSFRTVPVILQAVDAVFADPARTPGISQSATTIQHHAHRHGQAGMVRVWPLQQPETPPETSAFAPLDDTSARAPAYELAERIAATIDHWITSQRELPSQGRPVRAGDILVLVRRRNPLAAPIIAALKRHGIAVAGSDRMILPNELVAQDLMALGDFLTLPEDDLALASVLKSPLFALSDDDLIRLAPGRTGSLWSAMITSAKTHAHDAIVCDQLKRWRADADYLPPFEFFSALLSSNAAGRADLTYRQAILQRLGPDAADPLDEFLQVALRFDDHAPPSIQAFIGWLRASGYEIKRETNTPRDEVRLMTVHGAKGLEAPIVILPDMHANPHKGPKAPLIDLVSEARDGPGRDADAGYSGASAPLPTTVWMVPAAKHVAAVKSAKDQRDATIQEESNRLLYVAMTRARDELHMAGIAPKKPSQSLHADSWYAVVHDGLSDLLVDGVDELGHSVRELRTQQSVPPPEHEPRHDQAGKILELPDWAKRRAPADRKLQIPIAPSRLAPPEVDRVGDPTDAPPASPMHRTNDSQARDETASLSANPDSVGDKSRPPDPNRLTDQGLPQDPPAVSPTHQADDHRFLRGTLTHALLQHLPQLPPPRRKQAATVFVDRRGARLSAAQRSTIVEETLAILENADCQAAFGPGSRAEVAVAANIAPPDGQGPPLRISGQIDRLVVSGSDVLILDFKTNRPPPVQLGDVAPSYIMQLAAYRLAMRQLYPDKQVRAGLIWTDGARVMTVPQAMLDAGESQLWKAGASNLDAV